MSHIARPARRAAGLLLSVILVLTTSLAFAWALGTNGSTSQAATPIWEQQVLPQHSAALLGISGVVDTFSRAGWAVGESGTVLRTEDGGVTWRSQPSGSTASLRAVSALHAETAWAVGDGGVILATGDGTTWKAQESPSGEDLLAVAVLDTTHVWAVGAAGTVLFYDGKTWSRESTDTSRNLRGVTAADADHVWAAGDDGVILLRRGSSWTAQSSGVTADLRAISAAPGTGHAWACGDGGTILATTDGIAWAALSSPTHQTLYGISAADVRSVYAVGDGGIILLTSNGTAWTIRKSDNDNPLQAVKAVQGDRVWAAGCGRIETTEDAGATWTLRLKNETISRIASVDAVDAYRAWAAGDGGAILRTEDRGVTWLPQASGSDHYLNRIAAGSDGVAWAVGEGGIILNTADAGATWSTQYEDGHTSFRGLWATAARTAWVAGEGGVIKKTEDGGAHWVDQTSGTGEDLYAICALDGDTAWVAGHAGTMLFTVDGGAHWTPQATGTANSLYAVAVGDAETLWAAGDHGTLIASGDGGLVWTPQASGVTVTLAGVAAVDTHTAWIAGERGLLLKTEDAGASWAKQDTATQADLVAVDAVDGNIAWSAGEGATLLRTRDRARYFAEGHTGDGFQEYLSLFNPQEDSASVAIRYLLRGGAGISQQLVLPGASRITVDVNGAVGEGQDVSVIVQSDRSIQVERPVYFNYLGMNSGGAVTSGAVGPSLNWNFAEGYTGAGFDQYVCVLNPGSRPAAIMFDFQTEENGPVGLAGYIVPAQSRATYRVNDLLGGAFRNSLELRSTAPVIAERSMYFNYAGSDGGTWSGGHTVVGAPVLGTRYLFAEGTTRGGFDEYIALQNPGTARIQVNAILEPGGDQGAPVTRAFSIDAGKRQTLSVRDIVGTDKDVSVKVSCATPFLAERAIYFDYRGYGADWTGGSCVIGARQVSTEWLFAEGATGEAWHEYLCLQNPNSTDATVQVTYYTDEHRKLAPDSFVLPANSTITIVVNAHAGRDLRLAAQVRVTSGPGIVAERSLYFDFGTWTGGHTALGSTASD